MRSGTFSSRPSMKLVPSFAPSFLVTALVRLVNSKGKRQGPGLIITPHSYRFFVVLSLSINSPDAARFLLLPWDSCPIPKICFSGISLCCFLETTRSNSFLPTRTVMHNFYVCGVVPKGSADINRTTVKLQNAPGVPWVFPWCSPLFTSPRKTLYALCNNNKWPTPKSRWWGAYRKCCLLNVPSLNHAGCFLQSLFFLFLFSPDTMPSLPHPFLKRKGCVPLFPATCTVPHLDKPNIKFECNWKLPGRTSDIKRECYQNWGILLHLLRASALWLRQAWMPPLSFILCVEFGTNLVQNNGSFDERCSSDEQCTCGCLCFGPTGHGLTVARFRNYFRQKSLETGR